MTTTTVSQKPVLLLKGADLDLYLTVQAAIARNNVGQLIGLKRQLTDELKKSGRQGKAGIADMRRQIEAALNTQAEEEALGLVNQAEECTAEAVQVMDDPRVDIGRKVEIAKRLLSRAKMARDRLVSGPWHIRQALAKVAGEGTEGADGNAESEAFMSSEIERPLEEANAKLVSFETALAERRAKNAEKSARHAKNKRDRADRNRAMASGSGKRK